MIRGEPHTLEIWGDFGCFSRPEFKTERFSYPCPTPSAARGIFDAIYSKGYNRDTKVSEFYWQITKIDLLNLPSYIALRRNEVSQKVKSNRTISQWMIDPEKVEPLFADECRQQRQTMALRSPRFRIHAHIVPRPKFANQIKSLDSQFMRRAMHGKVFMQPCMGMREFPTFFKYITQSTIVYEPDPVSYNQDLGYMLYDVFDLRKVNTPHAKPFVSIFKAEILKGTLLIPPYESPEVLKPEVDHAE
ncbi:MAG: CRISPR-associated protein Cas5 [Syntrophales bacterium]|jgi:CRISPR-associated protein Cas5d|nr:CRISPR-associated protein Cas5 [Syntrophales bacterium]